MPNMTSASTASTPTISASATPRFSQKKSRDLQGGERAGRSQGLKGASACDPLETDTRTTTMHKRNKEAE